MGTALHPAIRECLDAGSGVATTSELLSVASWGMISWARRAGLIHRVLPSVYARSRLNGDDVMLIRAALAWAAATAAALPDEPAGPAPLATGPSALWLWGLPAPRGMAAHLEVGRFSGLRSRTGVVVHRPVVPGRPWSGRGLPRVTRKRAIVSSWSVLHGADRRAPVFAARRAGTIEVAQLREEQERHPRMRHRAEFLEFLRLVETGCESELEFRARTGPFSGPEFERIDWQRELVVAGHLVRLDGFDPVTRTAIELDGDAFHSTREQRRHDAQRGRWLAEAGINVVRFHFDDIVGKPDECRRELAAILFG